MQVRYMDYEITEQRIFLENANEKRKLEEFLKKEGIKLDENLEYTVGIYDGDKLMATGSFFRNTLRCLAVNSEYQGLGILNKVVSHLLNEQYVRGYNHIFLYTKCSTDGFFRDLGFYEIVRVKDLVVFMENKFHGVKNYSEALAKSKVEGESVASIVMNANPFTLGHLHLIEKAAEENDIVHVFAVSEEASVIPFEVRYELIKRGTQHLNNVILHKAGSYIISSATFPSYFIKEDKAVVEAHARLDLEVFKTYIVPTLGIKSRYVGEEPYCEITKTYNNIMKQVLEEQGIHCKIVPRLESHNEAISASRVRELIRNNNIEKIKEIVPKSTYEYFISEEAKPLINKIKINLGRH
jgi:[citrate (pro-3S)-lyase] ligase